MMHYSQDHDSVSLSVSFPTGTMQLEMRGAQSKALERANYRSTAAMQENATQAGEDPGELNSEKGFYDLDYEW